MNQQIYRPSLDVIDNFLKTANDAASGIQDPDGRQSMFNLIAAMREVSYMMREHNFAVIKSFEDGTLVLHD